MCIDGGMTGRFRIGSNEKTLSRPVADVVRSALVLWIQQTNRFDAVSQEIGFALMMCIDSTPRSCLKHWSRQLYASSSVIRRPSQTRFVRFHCRRICFCSGLRVDSKENKQRHRIPHCGLIESVRRTYWPTTFHCVTIGTCGNGMEEHNA